VHSSMILVSECQINNHKEQWPLFDVNIEKTNKVYTLTFCHYTWYFSLINEDEIKHGILLGKALSKQSSGRLKKRELY
jgi:hypothetical protein